MTLIPDLIKNDLATKYAYLVVNGCPDSRSDAAHVREYLLAMGYAMTEWVEEADLVLFFACGLTCHAEAISLAIVPKIKARMKPGAQFITGGCLPVINPDAVATVYDGPVFGAHPCPDLADLTDSDLDMAAIQANDLEPTRMPLNILERVAVDIRNQNLLFTAAKAWYTVADLFHQDQAGTVPDSYAIQIAVGCAHRCSYCVVPICRGRVRSKPITRVLQEFDQGLAQGRTVFALLASDAGSYGRDLGTDLLHLLREMIQREGAYQIRLRNCHPRYTIDHLDELMAIFESGRIPFFASTIQSGSNRILGLMRREYQAEELEQAMLAIQERFPQMQIRTQTMCGFPGETEADFEETLDYLDRVRHDFVEAYMYQGEPCVSATRLPDQIPLSVGSRRLLRLQWKAMTSRKR